MNADRYIGTTLLGCIAITASARQPTSEGNSHPKADASRNVGQAIEGVNADVVAARKATAEKRYADAEALMLKVTAAKPELIVPRMELGLAQLGLKKYPEAEETFKVALELMPPL